ncbi:hypothetical protein ACH4E7_44555 [Kitasatospora sp. NPDC018058]|uniref:hypothetical protein n=1 Tax=Kitasatospora sp. NPDC018058 TaxID=3364025 RepID=UPI0037BE45A1
MDDEALMRGRVYGADHDDPDPGPQPGHEYRELCAGPLDGLLLSPGRPGRRPRSPACSPPARSAAGCGPVGPCRPDEP